MDEKILGGELNRAQIIFSQKPDDNVVFIAHFHLCDEAKEE